jgi:adenylate kinase
VAARLATYDEKTRPLIDYYRNDGLLKTVDGASDAESIYKEIVRIITAQ